MFLPLRGRNRSRRLDFKVRPCGRGKIVCGSICPANAVGAAWLNSSDPCPYQALAYRHTYKRACAYRVRACCRPPAIRLRRINGAVAPLFCALRKTRAMRLRAWLLPSVSTFCLKDNLICARSAHLEQSATADCELISNLYSLTTERIKKC